MAIYLRLYNIRFQTHLTRSANNINKKNCKINKLNKSNGGKRYFSKSSQRISG